MNWSNLKNNKCPKCAGILVKEGKLHFCVQGGCDFRIATEKFDKIVTDLYKPKQARCMTFEANLEALNNLGHKEVTEDFSDSPYLN